MCSTTLLADYLEYPRASLAMQTIHTPHTPTAGTTAC